MGEPVMEKYKNYINGQWVDPSAGEWFDTDNPYTGETWAQAFAFN